LLFINNSFINHQPLQHNQNGMHEHPDTRILMPPGTYLEKLPHPDGSRSAMLELAIFKEHRFAFYFWNRWIQGMDSKKKPPSLVTIDWHRDLAPPSKSEITALMELNLANPETVAQYTWSQLDTHNDSHLLSAAYLNLIGDVYLLKNYGENQESTFEDVSGNIHHIFEYKASSEFADAIRSSNQKRLFLDVDLDYFVKEKIASHQLKEVRLQEDAEILMLFKEDSSLLDYLFPRLEGITIATEPRYCGGIRKSNHLLDVVLDCFFTPEMQWEHLR
jgi:hypothetical protein